MTSPQTPGDPQRSTRILDLLLIGLSTPVWAPVLAGTALLCRVRQGSPILFVQTRVGRQGRPFQALKFRTMIRDADDFLDEAGVPTLSRVTPLGTWLRRTGIDELPQIFNILGGSMSLVGPRPVLPDWVAKIPGAVDHPRFRVRPGLTGPAQIEGRNTVVWSRRLQLDTTYAESTTIGRYLSILARTPTALLAPTVSSDRNIGEVDDLLQTDSRAGSP